MRRPLALLLATGVALAGCAQVKPAEPAAPGVTASPTPPAAIPDRTAAPATPSVPGTAASPGAPKPARAGTCADVAAGMSLAQQAGLLVMMGVKDELDASEKAVLTKHEIGTVILMGTSTADVAGTKARTDAIRAAAPGVLVAVDQEGGTVQRLKGEGLTMPSAQEQAKMSDAELTTAAKRWGTQLKAAGVDVDLAPVADVVPAAKAASNEPVAKLDRGYGSTPDAVAAKVAAFVTGMESAGVGTSVKHFPNLGEVVGNTDFADKVVDDVTSADSPSMKAFKAGVDAGTSMVMVGTAYYPKIDGSAPAAFNPKIVGLTRSKLGFDGVVISDDLGAARAVAAVPASERAVRFVRAGGDLAISVEPAVAAEMAQGLATAAESDAALRERVKASAARVLTLKSERGLDSCKAVVG